MPAVGCTAVARPVLPGTYDVDPDMVFSVEARCLESGRLTPISYSNVTTAGVGSFGIVRRAELIEGGTGLVAVKVTKLNPLYRNRELQIMSAAPLIGHPCLVSLLYYFHEAAVEEGEETVYLNLVLEYLPETIYRTSRNYTKRDLPFPNILLQLYFFQLCRAVAHLHSLGICHRDIKPQNILIDPVRGVLKLCDFGSAKTFKKGETNVSYTCSRYYRAPELIFGATDYTISIDMWSIGCVMAELMLGHVLFPGSTAVNQLVEIIKVMGTPTHAEIDLMNPKYKRARCPEVPSVPFTEVFSESTSEAIDLVGRFLVYAPGKRVSAIEALTHPFFDGIKTPGCRLPGGDALPSDLFGFSRHELSIRPELIHSLVPRHTVKQLWETGRIDVDAFEAVMLSVLEL